MHYNKEDIKSMDRIERLKLINSLSGIKPANLIGTISNQGLTNLAIFSSVVHLGSNPPLLGFIMRPTDNEERHTYANILSTGFYTINHIGSGFIDKAHYTSAKFDDEVSEFQRCALTEEYLINFRAPFVEESTVKLGMEFKEAIDIKINGTLLMVGEIVEILMPEQAIDAAQDLDLEQLNGVGISGLNTYYLVKKVESFPYARVNEVPDFKKP